jgi:uncharacterized protein (DUF736 family)
MSIPAKKSNKVGCGYNKTTKSGERYMSLLLTADLIASLPVDEKGNIRLSVFPNTYKEKDSQPDVNIVPATSKASSGSAKPAATQGATNARAKGSNFPF